jgi:leucyl-tRNA synthetase
MVFLNHADKEGITRESYATYLRLLAPFAPHLTEELWESHGPKTSIHTEPWPQYDPEMIRDEMATLGVQINGKMRGTITLSPDASKDDAVLAAQTSSELRTRLTGTIEKVVYVPGKILSLVLRE